MSHSDADSDGAVSGGRRVYRSESAELDRRDSTGQTRRDDTERGRRGDGGRDDQFERERGRGQAERTSTAPAARLQRAAGNRAVQRAVRAERSGGSAGRSRDGIVSGTGDKSASEQQSRSSGTSGSPDGVAADRESHGGARRAGADGAFHDGRDGETDEGNAGNVAVGSEVATGASAKPEGEEASFSNEGGASFPDERGHQLPSDVRAFHERQFDRPLGEVRVHTGPGAASVARALGADAVTRGTDVYFGAGRYRPRTAVGRGLLVHELAHTVQQPDGGATTADAARVTTPGERLEREATAATRRLAAGGSVDGFGFQEADGPVVARQAATQSSAPVSRSSGGRSTAEASATTGQSQTQQGQDSGQGGGAGHEPIELRGSATVDPAAIAERLPEGQSRGEVPVRFGTLASGVIEVHEQGEDTYSTRGREVIDFTHPALDPIRQQKDLLPTLRVSLDSNTLSGFVSIRGAAVAEDSTKALVTWIENNPALMGWAGIDQVSFGEVTNSIEGGSLTLMAPGFDFRLGGFMDGSGKFGLKGQTVVFDASATVAVSGLSETELTIQRTETGALVGSVGIPVAFDTFEGEVFAEFGNGTVSIEGTASYTGEKFGGTATLLVTDAESAENLARERLGADAVKQSAEETEGEETEEGTEPAAGPKPGPRAVAGYGTLEVNLTDWLAGTADVIVDGNGDVTVVGEVAPPAEITLFEQKDYVHEFPRIEVKAIYGVPVVGNLNIFANIGLDALAKLGPGTLYDIALTGTYSTNPDVFQNYGLEATLNVSAYAGVRLRAEGGAGVTIVAHDLKAGVGVNGLAGIEGYVEATPTVGYREQADPKEGKTGEFFIAGHMEIAAQPSIGLGGDLFVELDSPTLSPAPDEKWAWPLGELTYPLPGQFGIGADVDYVLGSGEVPDIEFGEVDFDSGKFMSDLMNDNVKRGSDDEKETQGTFKDEGKKDSRPKVEKKKSKGSGKVAKKPTKRSSGAGSSGGGGRGSAEQSSRGKRDRDRPAPPPQSKQQQWLEGVQAINRIAKQAERDPLSATQVDRKIAQLKRQYGFTRLRAQRRGSAWRIVATMNPEHRTQWEAVREQIAKEEAAAKERRKKAEKRFGETTETVRGKQKKGWQTVGAIGKGTEPKAAGAGAKDLAEEQQQSAIEVEVVPISESRRGAHAEATIFEAGSEEHSNRTAHRWLRGALNAADRTDPVRLYVDNAFCSRCREMIKQAGGRITSAKSAEFTRATEAEDLEQTAKMRSLVDVNNAHGLTRKDYLKELKTLHGVGPVTANRILNTLLDGGRFDDFSELTRRANLPKNVVRDNKDSVTFGPANIENLRT